MREPSMEASAPKEMSTEEIKEHMIQYLSGTMDRMIVFLERINTQEGLNKYSEKGYSRSQKRDHLMRDIGYAKGIADELYDGTLTTLEKATGQTYQNLREELEAKYEKVLKIADELQKKSDNL